MRRFYVKKSRFSDSQIMGILKQAEAGTPVPELYREHGMSSALFYRWRAKFGGMDAIDDGAAEGTGRREPVAEEDVCGGTA
jgi:putative transposase